VTFTIARKVHKDDNHQETLAPGKKSCCVRDCANPIDIGFSRKLKETEEQMAYRYSAKALSFLATVVPPGQPARLNDYYWFPICTAHWQKGGRVEVYRDNGVWRCDVVLANGQFYKSYGPDGENATRPKSDYRICNRANDGTAYVAFGKDEISSSGFRTKSTSGWYEIPNRACQSFPLPDGYRGRVYLYIDTESDRWEGDTNLCVDPENTFELKDAERGGCGGYELYPFFDRQVNGGGGEYTLTPR